MSRSLRAAGDGAVVGVIHRGLEEHAPPLPAFDTEEVAARAGEVGLAARVAVWGALGDRGAVVDPAGDVGFQRAMDHAGAVVGPLIATLLLGLGVPLRRVFWLALIPGALSVLAVATVKEPRAAVAVPSEQASAASQCFFAGGLAQAAAAPV